MHKPKDLTSPNLIVQFDFNLHILVFVFLLKYFLVEIILLDQMINV